MDCVEHHDTYQPPVDIVDCELSTTYGRGCMVGWLCRKQGGTGPGCEKNCMFTRDKKEQRPNCFGFKFGRGILEETDFLYRPLDGVCLDCFHNLDCTNETERRWGGMGMELETIKMDEVSLVEVTKDLTVAMIGDPKREEALNVKTTFKEIFETVSECFKKECALKLGLEEAIGD